jgi:hypothetical protein
MAESPSVETIEDDVRMLAAMAYGESSSKNDEKEIYAIASVLERQRQARGYASIQELGTEDKTFSFVTSDGNERYSKLMKSTTTDIYNDAGMATAIYAARNAKSGGDDYSNGAYFWDGADIKSNYKKHFKVRNGIKITDPTHNIYSIEDSTKTVILYKTTKKKSKGKTNIEKVETGRYDHVYESTAGYGGTIFWKQSDDYLNLTKAKPHL